MKSITFLNEKGGVGKTTTCVTVGAGLAQRGARVLIIDADAQGHIAAMFGMEQRPAFYDWLVRSGAWAEVVDDVPMGQWIIPGEHPHDLRACLRIIASNHETRNVAGAIGEVFAVLRRLEEIRHEYDYVLIDTSPTPSLLHPLIYAATSHFVFVTLAESLSLSGLAATVARVREFDIFREKYGLPPAQLVGIQPCRMRRVIEHEDNLVDARHHFGHDAVLPPVRERIVWAEAARNGKSIFAFAPDTEAADEAWEVVDEVQLRTKRRTPAGEGTR